MPTPRSHRAPGTPRATRESVASRWTDDVGRLADSILSLRIGHPHFRPFFPTSLDSVYSITILIAEYVTNLDYWACRCYKTVTHYLTNDITDALYSPRFVQYTRSLRSW